MKYPKLDYKDKVFKYVSDYIRYDHLKEFLESGVIDDEFYPPEDYMDFIGSEDLTIINRTSDGKLYHYEYWNDSCWEGAYSKPEYDGLDNDEIIDKWVNERMVAIGKYLGLELVSYNFEDDISTIIFNIKELNENKFLTFNEFINESKSEKIIAYHGSAEKFTKFSYDNRVDSSGQIGSDLGFWFAFDKKQVLYFASRYPNQMYDELKDKKQDLEKSLEKEIGNIGERYSSGLYSLFNKLMIDEDDYSIKREFEKWVDLMDKKDYLKLWDILNGLIKYIGVRFLRGYDTTGIVKSYISEMDLVKKKIDDLEKDIYDFYDKNHKGYVYTVELNLNKIYEVDGEDIGTNWGRYSEIEYAQYNDYDAILIKNADTGGYIGDEICVFDFDKIKIIKIEEV